MTLVQFFRKMRAPGHPPYPRDVSELPPRAQAFITEHSKGLEKYTEAELDEITRRTLETPEAQRAMREADEAIRQRKANRYDA